jgi:hypothetical protein
LEIGLIKIRRDKVCQTPQILSIGYNKMLNEPEKKLEGADSGR